MKNLNKSQNNLAKIKFAIFAIFAISFGFLANFNFGANSENLAKAENGNFTKNSQNLENENLQNSMQNSINENQNPQNYEVKQLDFINFDGASYIKTGVNQVGKIRAAADFQFDDVSFAQWATALFGARASVGDSEFSFIIWNFQYRTDYGDIAGTDPPYKQFGSVDENRHTVVKDDNATYFDGVSVDESSKNAPSQPIEIFLGGMLNGAAGTSGVSYLYYGRVYSFEIYKNDVLVLNLIPAARFLCGENSEVEYGFANDLDDDGDLANDEWFGNSGTGNLTSNEEISAEKCAEKPENSQNDSQNSDENNENSVQNSENNSEDNSKNSDNSAKILAPNTGMKF